ncbi:hypothetical protein KN63_00935 [Smithella sp. F21]|nr:hypothetical protein KN63_00935 [Smithella sp. F21]
MPTIGKGRFSGLAVVSFSKLGVIFCALLPLEGVLERAAEDNVVNLPDLLIRTGGALSRL